MSMDAQPTLFDNDPIRDTDLLTASLEQWCLERLGTLTSIQQAAWPVLRAGRHALLLSATGQGKSLAGWLPLVERHLASGANTGQLRALHIAPLKALACDMTHNLQPLMLAASAIAGQKISMDHRSGDTTGYERDRQLRKPPAFLATTPETLFILLSSTRGRRLLHTVQAVVIDEIHVMAQSKRGAHLALSLERLDRLTHKPLQRIGLSATAKPADALSDWLTGERDCEIIQAGANKTPTVQIERLASSLG
ncbi:MAG: DEAD/DEAH box helicase, partial [Pseudomonadota bacterium]